MSTCPQRQGQNDLELGGKRSESSLENIHLLILVLFRFLEGSFCVVKLSWMLQLWQTLQFVVKNTLAATGPLFEQYTSIGSKMNGTKKIRTALG